MSLFLRFCFCFVFCFVLFCFCVFVYFFPPSLFTPSSPCPYSSGEPTIIISTYFFTLIKPIQNSERSFRIQKGHFVVSNPCYFKFSADHFENVFTYICTQWIFQMQLIKGIIDSVSSGCFHGTIRLIGCGYLTGLYCIMCCEQ